MSFSISAVVVHASTENSTDVINPLIRAESLTCKAVAVAWLSPPPVIVALLMSEANWYSQKAVVMMVS